VAGVACESTTPCLRFLERVRCLRLILALPPVIPQIRPEAAEYSLYEEADSGKDMRVPDVPADRDEGLIDLTGLSVGNLDKLAGSALSRELLRVLRSGSSEGETIAGFNQSV
jgi:hypothetical protein